MTSSFFSAIGFLDSAATWVINFPTESLAFLLADRGYVYRVDSHSTRYDPFILSFPHSEHSYDVWLANSRGDGYSNNNTQWTPDDSEFWNWSWDQMAEYDVPATIDFVLSETGHDNLTFVGHSQGIPQLTPSWRTFARFLPYKTTCMCIII